jgi:hypothetical protein
MNQMFQPLIGGMNFLAEFTECLCEQKRCLQFGKTQEFEGFGWSEGYALCETGLPPRREYIGRKSL